MKITDQVMLMIKNVLSFEIGGIFVLAEPLEWT